jgi:thioredoxin reductase (NADPH)
MSDDIFDVAIIGAGPAGFSAVLNLYARKKKIILFGNFKSSAIYKAHKIKNYLGEIDISGKELLNKFNKQIISLGITNLLYNVAQIFYYKNIFNINCNNQIYFSRSIVLATGLNRSKNIEGEEKFLGHGVSYCATCDGMFFKDKTICVITYDKYQENEIIFLSNIVKKIYIIFYYKANKLDIKNIKILNKKVKKIIGDDFLCGVEFFDDDKILKCDGIFIFNKNIQPDKLLPGLKINKNNFIDINKNFETNIDCVYACGDCVGGVQQINKAIGEGQIVAHNLAISLDNLNNNF